MVFNRIFKQSIEKLRESKDIPGLVNALSDEDAALRNGAALALVDLGETGIRALLEAFGSLQPSLVRSLLNTIAGDAPLTRSKLVPLIRLADTGSRQLIAKELSALHKPENSDLVAGLKDPLPRHRLAAAVLLSARGQAAEAPLRAVLGDPDTGVGKAASWSLKTLGWKGNVPEELALYHLYLSEWPQLVRLKQHAIPVLLKAVRDQDPLTRREAVRALGKIRNINTLQQIAAILSDPEPDVRAGAVEALSELGDPGVVPSMVKALQDPHHQVRMEAAWALDRLGWEEENDADRIRYLIAKGEWNELAKMGRPAIQPLILALKEEYSGVKIGATEALLRIGRPAEEALIAASSSNDKELRAAVLRTREVLERRREEESRKKLNVVDPGKYERELEEGVSAQKKYEAIHGSPKGAAASSSKTRSLPQEEKKRPKVPQDELTVPRVLVKGQVDLSRVPVTPAPPPPGEEKTPSIDGKNIEELNKAIAGFHRAGSIARGAVPLSVGSRTGKRLSGKEPEPAAQEEDRSKAPATGPGKGPEEPVLLQGPVMPQAPPKPIPDEEAQKRDLERLLGILQDPDEHIRTAAIEALRVRGDAGIEHLMGVLSDRSPVVRAAACDALGDIGNILPVPSLVSLVEDKEEDVRVAAIRALGNIGDSRVIPLLIRSFTDDSFVVRNTASDAVVRMGEGAFAPLVLSLDDERIVVRITAVRALGKTKNPGIITPLLKKIGDPMPELRHAVAQALGNAGEPALDPLLKVLDFGNKSEQLGALDALALIVDDRATGALQRMINSPDPDISAKAARLLKKRNALNLWKNAWAEQLQKEKEAPKAEPARLQLVEEAAIPEDNTEEVNRLVDALKGSDTQAQVSAAFRLIVLGRPAVEGLLRILKTEDPGVQLMASEIIGEMWDVAVDPLIEALSNEAKLVRIVAARNLGRIGDPKAFDALLESMVRETDSEVRSTVTEALGYMGDPRAIAPLGRALRDRDERVQVMAARSLGYLGGVRVVEPLIHALGDVDESVRRAALDALKDPQGRIQEHLVNALRQGDRGFAMGVAEALDRIGWKPQNPVDEAYYLIAREQWGRIERLGPAALPPLRELLEDPNPIVRIEAVKVISHIGGIEAIPLLLRAIRDDHLFIRRRAEQALIDMGDTAVGALTPLVSTGDPVFPRIIRKISERKEEHAGEPDKPGTIVAPDEAGSHEQT